MNKSELFYKLSIEDIQDVAMDSLERELSEEELLKVIPIVEKNIPWFDIIDDAITEIV